MHSLIAAYKAAGWQICAIPAGQKGPITPGWNEKGVDDIPDGTNVGLLHSLSNTCAFDIDDLELSTPWFLDRGVDLPAMLADPVNVKIISGRENSAKMLFKLVMPLPSKKINLLFMNKVTKTAFEFRCASAVGKSVQDVLPPSVHPSGSVYKWEGDWTNLPVIPESLFNIWMDLLTEVKPPRITPSMVATSLAEVESATNSLNPDCGYEPWIQVGFAIRDAAEKAGDLDAGFAIWDDWSAQGEKYKAREMIPHWRSFKDKPNKVTVATLFKMAFEAGWKKLPPDLEGMFGPVLGSTKAQIEEKLSPANKVPPTDVTLWPARLSKRSLEVAAEVGCDVAVPLLAGLSAVSAAADKRISLRITPTWAVPPVFWTMTIGEPADKKTPASKPMLLPLRKLEADDKPRYEAEMLGWVGKEAKYAAQSKAYREWSASPEAELPGSIPPKLDSLPIRPEPLRLLVNDATSQKVVALAQYRPRGFLMWFDEMHNWLGKLGNGRSTEDRGCWIQLFETGPYTMDRVGAGTISADNLAGSIYGNCQPAVFREHMSETATDGLLQRFLPVVIDPDKNGMWQHGLPHHLSSSADYEQLLRETYRLPQFEYIMEPAGLEDFRTFGQWCIDFRKAEQFINPSAPYQTAIGKLEGQAARLILLCHLINEPHCPFVSAETVRQGVQLLHKFFLPMLRFTFLEVAQQRDSTTSTILSNILQLSGVRETITLGELRRFVRKHPHYDKPWIIDAIIRGVMDDLAAMNHVAMHEDHPRNPTWAINPAMAEAMKEDRVKIITSKQSVIEQLRRDVFEKHGVEARIGDAVGINTI